MQSSTVDPITLAALPGFEESRQELRREAELPMFADSHEYDLAAYQSAWRLGRMTCFAVQDDDGTLAAWGVVTSSLIPRRANVVYATDVMWSRDAQAGGMLLRRMMKFAAPEPLFVTGRAGGRLSATLENSTLAEHTHNVYTLTHRTSS